MGRKATRPRFYPERGGYFVVYLGARHRLVSCDHDDSPDGPNYLSAMEEFQRIMQQGGQSATTVVTVAQVVDEYLTRLQKDHPSSYSRTRGTLSGFVSRCGHLPVSGLSPKHVLDWIESHKAWEGGTKGQARNKVRAAFNFATRVRLIDLNPLAGLYRPASYASRSRGEEYCPDPDIVAKLVRLAREPYRAFLVALATTGARPGEIRNAEHYHYSPTDQAIIFRANPTRGYVWKNARKKRFGQTDRIIFLPDEVEEHVRQAVKRKGFIWADARGKRWNEKTLYNRFDALKQTQVVRRMLDERGANPDHLIPYGLRHRWITDCLLRGVSPAVVADAAGTSIEMIQDSYGHALKDRGMARRLILGL